MKKTSKASAAAAINSKHAPKPNPRWGREEETESLLKKEAV